jgi:serine/threonine protein kinase
VVALKVLRQHLAEVGDALNQFQRELQAVTRLSHANIVKTYDADQVGDLHYFAMEFVEGMDLHKFVQQVGPLPVEQACDYARQVAQGLQHAHQVGLVHRDVKPANLFLLHPPLPLQQPAAPGSSVRRGPDSVVKIIDWGLARCLRDPAAGDGAAAGPAAEAFREVGKGKLVGTADFIAPEQARDASLVDTRADIYSLGCTLYYLLTGQVPFPGGSLLTKLLQHQEVEAPSVRLLRPEVPEELDGILQKMLAKCPEDRYQIPLLVVAPLRHFCPGASAVSGSVIRPASGINLPGTRPGSSPALSPSSSSSLARPGSSSSLARPGLPGHGGPISRPGNNGNGQPPRGHA